MSSRRPEREPYTGDTIPMQQPDRGQARPPRQHPPQPSPQYPPPDQRAARRPPPPDQRGARRPPPPPSRPQIRPPLPSQRPRGNQVLRWLRRGMLLLIIALIAALVGTIVFQQRVAAKVALADVRENRPGRNLLVAPMNVLLLGVDLRTDFPGEGVRSDSLILLHLDPAGGWASMLSIPRDSVATVPDLGESKINAAFGYGYANAEALYGPGVDAEAAGAALAADTVEEFLGLRELGQRINYVATINFNGFAKMIDAIGGIEVDVPFEIIDTEYPTEDFGYMTVQIPAGRQQMDGTTALQYVRTRHADSDFGRAQRQQQVLQAIVQKLRSRPLLLRPIAALRLVDAAGDATKTTMPVGRIDALLMGTLLSRIDPARIGQYRIDPERVGLQEFGSDLYWDRAGVQALVQEALTPPGEAREAATIQVLNGAGVGGVAGRVSELLAGQNFSLAGAGNTELAETSQIIDYGAHPLTRERLSGALGGMPIVERPAEEAPPDANIVVVLGADYTQYVRDQ